MLPALLVFGAITLGYYFYQQSGLSSADAPGHCDAATQEGCMRYSYDEILAFAQNAGFGSDAPTAAAIAIAESGGDASAYNPEPQDVPGHYCRASSDDGLGSIGLWQIYRAAHPELSCVDLTDPNANAQAAFHVFSKRGSFRDWSTFLSGAYQKFVQ